MSLKKIFKKSYYYKTLNILPHTFNEYLINNHNCFCVSYFHNFYSINYYLNKTKLKEKFQLKSPRFEIF